MRNLILFVTKKLPFHEIGAGRDHGATVQVEVVIHQKVKLVRVQGRLFCIFDRQGGSFTGVLPIFCTEKKQILSY